MQHSHKQLPAKPYWTDTSIASNSVEEILCEDRKSLYLKVANRCATQLTRGIEKHGLASFIVPGGSTPAPVFERLSKMSLLWGNVIVTPSDERWLPVDHADSNERLIKQTLLVNQAAKARFVGLKNNADSAKLGELQTEKDLAQLPQPFDAVVLGMGNDGHFASLFPASYPIEQGLDPQWSKKCIAIDATGCPVAGDNPNRMSLTLSAILNSQLVILLITGEQKLAVLRQAAQINDPLQFPISALLHQKQTRVEIYWAE